MKIELLTSQLVPCTEHTAFAGMVFEVEQESRSVKCPGVWIRHMTHPLFVLETDYRVLDEQQRSRDFITHRAILSPCSHRGNEVDSLSPRSTLPCGCRKIGVLEECPLHDRTPSPFNVYPAGRPL